MTDTLAHRMFRKNIPAEALTSPGASATSRDGSPGEQGHLRRSISTFQLTMIGVGGTIGTGIFFILSEAVPEAGPAVISSFLLAAVVAGLTVLCYAELASTIPSSGSSYSYSYATLGEAVAFIVGACLVLEYGVSAAAVAVGWSEYLNLLLEGTIGWQFPEALSVAPDSGGVINLPAMILVGLCVLLLLRGASESARANAIMVIIKVSVLVLFIAVGLTGFQADHFSQFAPFGFAGVSIATGSIFFSFIGLDAIATAGEEVHNPKKSIPIALMASLAVVTVVYLLVAVVAVGAQPWQEFEGQKAGLATILENLTGSQWPGLLLAAGAVISIFSVTLICLYGQTRILFAMGRDGLIPRTFSRIDRRTQTPMVNTIIVGVVVAILAGVIPLGILADLTSIGTLVAFLLVSVGVMVLRRTAPELPRGFKVPGYPVTPVLSVLACAFVISGLDSVTLIAFVIWAGAALVFYFSWSIKHSALETLATTPLLGTDGPTQGPTPPKEA